MIPVKVISSSDLEENGGVYLVKKGVAAMPVHGFTTQGNRAVSSKAVPVYVVSDAEFNAGDFVKGRGQPVKVGDIDDLGFVGVVEGREAIPVYAVNDWPPSDDALLDSDYLVYEGAMVVAPSSAWRTAANQLFVDWKAALGVDVLADAMDIAYIFAAETEQAALLNMVKRAHDATNVNAVAFEANRGVTGNGSTSYLNTNYNPSTDGVAYLLDSSCLGVYSRTNSSADIGDAGAFESASSNQAWLLTSSSSGFLQYAINADTTHSISGNFSSSGTTIVNRDTSNSTSAYRNGTLKGSPGAVASSNIPNLNLFICARNFAGNPNAHSSRQYSMVLAGRSMTAQEHEDTYNAWQTFLTAIGAQV